MNFFPGIYQNKRIKKPTNFANLLTGAVYNNKDFIANCRNVPRSISNLDHISQLKYTHDNHQQQNTKKHNQFKHRTSMKKQNRKRIERQIIAVHATSRLAEPAIKNSHKSVILTKKCIKAFDSDLLAQIQMSNQSKAFGLNRINKQHNLQNNLQRQKHNISQSQIKSSHTTRGLVFPDIQILVLDLLNKSDDFRTKIVRINLQKYFRSFFKKQLSGHFTEQFMNKVQFYVQKLIQKQTLDDPVDQQQYPLELFTLSSRIAFLNKINQFESRRTNTSNQYIQTLIKHYCVPSREFRESCIRDILLMLSLQIFEKFNCSRLQQYVLLDQNGKQITEILQIKFNTQKMFLTSKKNAMKNYSNYLKLLDDYYNEGKKLNFNQNIKLNFRHKLANGKVDENHFNYCQNYQIQKMKRLFQLQNAQTILKKRSQTHRVNKFANKQQMIYYERPFIVQKQSVNQKNSKQGIQSQEYIKNAQLEDTNAQSEPSQFWKIQNTRISPQLVNKNSSSPIKQSHRSRSRSPNQSKSPTRTQSPFRKQNRRQNQVQRSKLKQFINDGKKKNINANLQKKFKQQFKELVGKNDFVDFKFNHMYKDRVMKSVLKQYFSYFKQKSDLQVDKIFQAVKSATISIKNINTRKQNQQTENYNTQNNENENTFNNIQIRQFPQQQSSSNLNHDTFNLQNTLNWQQFKNLRTIISCMQPKQILMAFVGNYLNFNQFGQLSKEQLFDQIQIILGENTQSSTVEVISEVIWSWFLTNSVIQNDIIRRSTLQSWYEKYKIVYCMLISLIFGTSHKNALDLAYQILV